MYQDQRGKKLEKEAREIEGIRSILTFAGFSGTNTSFVVLDLKPFKEDVFRTS